MKFFLKSKTIIGVIIGVLPALLPTLGLDYSEDDHLFISQNIDLIITGVGAVLAIYGRFNATQQITVKPNDKL